MARVVDVRERDSEEESILYATSGDGFLSGAYLRDEPLASYLSAEEVPQFAFRNKNAGVKVEGSGALSGLVPASDYRAVGTVTDVRVVFVVGTDEGDEELSLPLSDVVSASVRSGGLRKEHLRIETQADQTLVFPSKGDIEPVADFIDGAAQVWASAVRTCETAEETIATASEHVDAGRYDAAMGALADVGETLASAVEDLAELGPGAEAALSDRLGTARTRRASLVRAAQAGRAAEAHAAAQAAWRDRAFERAAVLYDRAIEGYETALESDGDEPTETGLQVRCRAAARERSLLRVAPVVDVDTLHRRAAGIEEAEQAARAWERALERTQEYMGLEWDGEDRSFRTDRSDLQDRAATASREAIDAHREAGRGWLAAGDRIAARGREAEAEQAYHRARPHLQAGLELAEEVFPDRVDELEADLAGLEARNEGEGTPGDVEPVDAPLPVAALDDVLAGEPVAASQAAGAADAAEGGADTGVDARPEPAAEAPTGERGDTGAGPHRAPGDGETTGAAHEPTGPTAAELPPEECDPATLARALRSLSEDRFVSLVAYLWAVDGWSTSVFSGSGDAVYDVVAVKDDRRLLIWVKHRPDGGSLEKTDIDRVAATRGRSHGVEDTTVVTSGGVASAAERAAIEENISVVGGEAVCERLLEADQLHRLPQP